MPARARRRRPRPVSWLPGGTRPASCTRRSDVTTWRRFALQSGMRSTSRCLLRDELTTEVVSSVGGKHQERLRSGFAFFLSDAAVRGRRTAKSPSSGRISGSKRWQEVGRSRRSPRSAGASCAPTARLGRLTFGSGSRHLRSRPPKHARCSSRSSDELEEADVEGHRSYLLAGTPLSRTLEPSLRLLPEYDVYVMGFPRARHPDSRCRQRADRRAWTRPLRS